MLKSKQPLTQSFRNAARGLYHTAGERSFFIQLCMGGVALILAFVLALSLLERVMIILLVALVLALETFNTAIEILLDHVTPEQHSSVARIKDVMAAGVFIISLCALIIGILIFADALMPSLRYA